MPTTIQSKEMSLRNLATDVTREIKDQMINQDILSIPFPNYRDENYAGNTGIESLFDIDERVKNIDQDVANDGLMRSMTFGLYKQGLQDEKSNDDNGAIEGLSLRFGESPVLNAPWQFNELDDVRSNTTYPHMGRVYLTYIYSNFPILTIQPGREKMNANLLTFFTKGLGSDHKVLNDYIRNGGNTKGIDKIRIGLISVKNATLGVLEGALGLMGINFSDASKFITFKPAMKLYRQLANNLLREFAANLGLLNLTKEKGSSGFNFEINSKGLTTDEQSYYDKLKESLYDENGVSDTEKAEEFSADSIEISDPGDNASFGEVKDMVESAASSNLYTKDLGQSEPNASSYRGTMKRLDILDMIPHIAFKNIGNGISQFFGDVENRSYLPFLCQSNISISETFSNSTKEHPIVGQINSMSESASDTNGFGNAQHIIDSYQSVLGGQGLENIVNDTLAKFTKKVTGNIGSNFSEMGAIMNGDGKLLIPEIWSSSSYSRSYSVEFEFWSPVGDIVSIFENVYIPYLLLVVLTAPLQTGYSSYLSPFAIKVFSKGLFSVDFGMIESLTVTRGDASSDRTKDNFPRSIKVSVGIKDLSPIMMLSLGNGAFWKYKRANSSLSEYIATMCNLSIADRLSVARHFEQYWALLTSSVRDKFSLNSIGFAFGSNFFLKPAVAWNKGKVTVDQVNTKNIYY